MNSKFRVLVLKAGLCMALMPCIAVAQLPTALTDTIKKGSGTIDLLLDASAAELTQYLASGSMFVGVDLNEEAAGIESASSVGVAIKEMTLHLETTAGSFTFSEFYTNTSAMIMEAGATAAEEFQTLFGSAGGSQITGGSGFDLSTFDDVVTLDNITVSGEILSATMSVEFVTTDQSGDNETFFDYSAGFEQFALVTNTDAQLLDAANTGINEFTPVDSGLKITAPTGTPEPYWFLFVAVTILLAMRKRLDSNEAALGGSAHA